MGANLKNSVRELITQRLGSKTEARQSREEALPKAVNIEVYKRKLAKARSEDTRLELDPNKFNKPPLLIAKLCR